MADIQEVQLKKEKRFTRKNDEVFDLLCKCFYSAYGRDREDLSYLSKETNVDTYGSYDSRDAAFQKFFEVLAKAKLKQELDIEI